MPLRNLSDEEMKDKLHRREEVRAIVAERGLTDIFKIDPEFMKRADGIVEEDDLERPTQSKWKQGAKIAMNRVAQVAGSIAGAAYLTTNAANTGGAAGLAYGYFAGGLPGFVSSLPGVIKQGQTTVTQWDQSSNYERYRNVKKLVGEVNGLAGNTRNVVVQSTDGFAGVTFNKPGFTYTESGVNPAQLEADIGFNIIRNALVAIDGVEQIHEGRKRKQGLKDTTAAIQKKQIEGLEEIGTIAEEERIHEIINSLKGPKTKKGTFIPALTKMLGVVEDLHQNAVTEGASREKLQQLDTVKDYLKENMAAFEEAEKMVRTNAMAMRQANLDTAIGAYDLIKGSVSVAAVSSRFVSSPMGGIAGLVDGLSGVVGAAALKGQFFGFEELWDGKSIIGQRNRRKAAAREVDAAICLCGDRDYDVKSATRQLVEDVIQDYNRRNPEDTVPLDDETKRSFASKVYYEMGSVERSKAGLGNNIMLIRAAELRTAALEEPAENGPYHWCIKSLGLKCTGGELPGVDEIAQRMGCNRNWRDLVKTDEIDKKEKKWAVKQALAQEEDAADRSRQAREVIDQALERVTSKRRFGRDIMKNRVYLGSVEDLAKDTAAERQSPQRESVRSESPQRDSVRSESPQRDSIRPESPQPAIQQEAQVVRPKKGATFVPLPEQLSPGSSQRTEGLTDAQSKKPSRSVSDIPATEPKEKSDSKSGHPHSPAEKPASSVRQLSTQELDAMGLKTRQGTKAETSKEVVLPDVPTHDPGEKDKELQSATISKPGYGGKLIRRQAMKSEKPEYLRMPAQEHGKKEEELSPASLSRTDPGRQPLKRQAAKSEKLVLPDVPTHDPWEDDKELEPAAPSKTGPRRKPLKRQAIGMKL